MKVPAYLCMLEMNLLLGISCQNHSFIHMFIHSQETTSAMADASLRNYSELAHNYFNIFVTNALKCNRFSYSTSQLNLVKYSRNTLCWPDQSACFQSLTGASDFCQALIVCLNPGRLDLQTRQGLLQPLLQYNISLLRPAELDCKLAVDGGYNTLQSSFFFLPRY